MAELIIQVLNLRGRVIQSHRVPNLPVTVGRGFDNDIILSDPYVCPRHAVISHSQDGWMITDQDSKNGIYIKNHKRSIQQSGELASGDVVVVGKTHMKVVSPSHQVAEAKKIQVPKSKLNRLQVPIIGWALTAVFMLLVMSDAYLDIGDRRLSDELFETVIAWMVVFGIILAWSGAWSFIGRLLRNKTRFHHHLIIAASSLIAITAGIYLNDLIGYNACNADSRSLLQAMFIIILLGGTFAVSLGVATKVNRVRIGLISISVVALFMSVFIYSHVIDQHKFSASPQFESVLIAPWAQMVDGESLDRFFNESEKLYEELEKKNI